MNVKMISCIKQVGYLNVLFQNVKAESMDWTVEIVAIQDVSTIATNQMELVLLVNMGGKEIGVNKVWSW